MHLSDQCVLCQGRSSWRMSLSNCSHIVCIQCVLDYLQSEDEQFDHNDDYGYLCPQVECSQLIHENDVDALMDVENDRLDQYMDRRRRVVLKNQHDRRSILQSLGGNDNPDWVRSCPGCHQLYGVEDGCNYVRCPDKSCMTWWCWQCGLATNTWQHFFTEDGCSAGWTDIWRATWPLRFLLSSRVIVMIILAPLLWTTLFIGFPLYIAVTFPWLISQELKCRIDQMTDNPIVSLLISFLFLPLLFMMGLLLAVASYFCLISIWVLYIAITVAKMIPMVNRGLRAMKMIEMVAGMLRFDEWKDKMPLNQGKKPEEDG